MNKKVKVIIIILLIVSLVGNGYAIYVNQQQNIVLEKQLKLDKAQTDEIGNLTKRQLNIANTMKKIVDYIY